VRQRNKFVAKADKKKRIAKAALTSWQGIREQVKYVDLLIEVCDARAPLSSRHAKAREMFAGKPFLLVLNKSDLADEKTLSIHLERLNQSPDQRCIALSLKKNTNKKAIFSMISGLTALKREKQAKKGIRQQALRICVIGMPNVGKSSLINWLVGRSAAKAADKPGVTRGPQWIRLSSNLELLDTPGILPKDNLSQKHKDNLAILNLLNEGSDDESLANKALFFLKAHYQSAIKRYLNVDSLEDINLENLAGKRNFISPGGKYNLMRAASTLLTDLRGGKLGGVCLDQDL
jgi:ribosome biogenesis GTPase A